MAIQQRDLTIQQGKTFQQIIRWEKEPFVYVPITSIAQTAPARIVCSQAHGLVDGWRVAPVSVKGMRQINPEDAQKLRARDFHRVTIVDSTTVDLNEVNAAEYSPYTSGGYLQFYTPASLAGCTARMSIKTAVGGDELLSLTTEDNRIVLDDDAKTITLLIDAATTAALASTRGVYDLEIQDGTGFVTGLFEGAVTVHREVTT